MDVVDSRSDQDWMRLALTLAQRAAAAGEVPVGALLVRDGVIIGEGWNRPIKTHDASAHAEIQALRDAGQRVGNYRLPGTTLYVTLEPCVMCAGAIVHARVGQVIYGAPDPKAGACGSVFDLLPSDARFNHRTDCKGGVLTDDCAETLRAFFRARRSTAFKAATSRPETSIMSIDNVYSDDAIRNRLATELPRWSLDAGCLQRTYRTSGWKGTLMVINTVGHLAEAAWHHPDLTASYDRVTVSLTTHSAKGVTDKDFELANRIEETVMWRPASGSALEGTPDDVRYAYIQYD